MCSCMDTHRLFSLYSQPKAPSNRQLLEQWNDIVEKDPLAEVFETDKEFLWNYRYVCTHTRTHVRICTYSTCVSCSIHSNAWSTYNVWYICGCMYVGVLLLLQHNIMCPYIIQCCMCIYCMCVHKYCTYCIYVRTCTICH